MLPLLAGFGRRVTAQVRLTQREAGYQSRPNGIQMCGNCTLFISPDGCRSVDGTIDRFGWCKLYDLAD